MGGIEYEWLDSQDVELAIIAKCFGIAFDVDDLPDKLSMHADFHSVQQSALKNNRELRRIRSIHQFTSDRGQTGDGKLVNISTGSYPTIISFRHFRFTRYAD